MSVAEKLTIAYLDENIVHEGQDSDHDSAHVTNQ